MNSNSNQQKYSVNEKVKVKLPVSGQEILVRRMTWGERLEVDAVASAGTKDGSIRDLRKFRQVLVQYATKSASDKNDGMTEVQFFGLDPTDGFYLVEETGKINLIDHPSFLPPSDQAKADTETFEMP